MKEERQWLSWAIELQSIAQAGLQYGHDRFDKERYQRLREIAAEIMAAHTGIPEEKVTDLFCSETGYQTPKIDTRAAIIRDGRILLVRENTGRWSLPGGWCDVDLSIGENTVKEIREEAGLDARALRLIAVQDRDRHNLPRYAWKLIKIFVLCEATGGSFKENIETTESGWFSPGELPVLAEEKNTADQIALCFRAAADPAWIPPFD